MAHIFSVRFHPSRVALAAAALLGSPWAAAQSSSPAPPAAPAAQLAPVIVRGSTLPVASVSGWGDIPLAEVPVQTRVITDAVVRDLGAHRLADLIGQDASVSDAYNTEGYWDYLTMRGYGLDNRYNYRRDGLPINAETSIPLENKAGVELLKGLSGLQAGTSSPGGLVNYVVKRPLATPLRSVSLEWRQAGSVSAAADLSQRFGTDQAFGLRLNAAAARLDPLLRSTRGERSLVALAGDWRVSPDTLIEAEIERSRRSQPSAPGFSLLGDRVPAPVDPRINLNNQPWSLPVVLDGTTGSLGWQQRLAADWRLRATLATQRLHSDDRVAFPFGCTAEDGTYYADRYCPDGTYDLYDFRSDNERRRTDVADLSVQGKLTTGALQHALSFGMQHSRVRDRFQRQAFNYAGSGNVQATAVVAAASDLTDEGTDRDERSTEVSLRDAVRLGERFTVWGGLRHTRLARQSVRTDGSRATDYRQSFTTPWLAASYAYTPGSLVYASWGKGIESEVAPNRDRYVNRSEPLAPLTSRQTELGVRSAAADHDWGLALFDISRPTSADIGACDVAGSCVRQFDGTAHHRGMEANVAWRPGRWNLQAGAQWLRARREGSQTAAINGLEPTNVPARTVRLQAQYSFASVPDLALQARYSHESSRAVVPDNSARIDGYGLLAVAMRYESLHDGTRITWRAGVDNLLDERAWKESPYQFSHAYLFPVAPRTLRLSVQIDLR
ncbi:MAG: TonB-dependent siderophore receptor [Burkholderiaceae bacterium]